jgi:(R,R)-butanediol dehydrogenase/meso-butanediol dehydrogenase/diacetyl reductase
MPAAVYVGDGIIDVQDLPVPELRAHEVLVEVSHCGICGTDLHLVIEQYARPGSVLGHEWSGRIAACGPDVAGWATGARVVANPTAGCGECRACRRGRPSVCLRRGPTDLLDFSRGAFCRYKVVDAARLLAIPETLSTRAAALAEPTAITLHALNIASVTQEDRVLITGGGPVGLLLTAALRANGVDDITVSEPSPARRARARELGATPCEPADLPRAPMGRPVDNPFTVAFDCSGNARAIQQALDQLDYAGTLVFVGTGHEHPRIDHNRAIVFELTIVGTYNYDAAGFAPALELLASGRLPIELLVEPRDIGLAEIGPTLQRLANGELPGKVFVVPR